eukprot:scaffold1147_cov250-Pinguiococcus_pyrenoidosus.AAC.9
MIDSHKLASRSILSSVSASASPSLLPSPSLVSSVQGIAVGSPDLPRHVDARVVPVYRDGRLRLVRRRYCLPFHVCGSSPPAATSLNEGAESLATPPVLSEGRFGAVCSGASAVPPPGFAASSAGCAGPGGLPSRSDDAGLTGRPCSGARAGNPFEADKRPGAAASCAHCSAALASEWSDVVSGPLPPFPSLQSGSAARSPEPFFRLFRGPCPASSSWPRFFADLWPPDDARDPRLCTLWPSNAKAPTDARGLRFSVSPSIAVLHRGHHAERSRWGDETKGKPNPSEDARATWAGSAKLGKATVVQNPVP